MTDRVDAAEAARGFTEYFGHTPVGVWSAPGRVNLIGEHTDYNDGFVFPFALDRRTVVALGDRDDQVLRVSSTFAPDAVSVHLDDLTPDAVSGWAAYPLGIAWALRESGADLAHVRGVDLHLTSDVPIGAGLSSSAAIECAVALALNEHWGLGFDRPALAKVGQLAENRVVGAPTGIMDQSASLLGEPDAGVFLDCRSLDAEVIPLGFRDAGLVVLVIDTHVSHAHASGGYAARRASCEAGARALGVPSLREVRVADLARAEAVLDEETFRRVRHVVTENQRVLSTVRALHEQGPAAIGPFLDASHASMRDDFEISVPELDAAVEAAVTAGALGARMTGGGFGGAAIALVAETIVPVVTESVLAAFEARGFREPTVFTVAASEGARRDG
ncbi:galactokinase [Agromyces aerolatus]|uniref:galactokinase n=1 Tax=Agromyces sp. LY-1074 TaxID=3074080 RepID=UPI002855FC8B|nr:MULTISPECIES: galactokinase [unclassified Agromyces]MDR5698257.1 galactokinase [Agromyces sp. LY-1074]MDR5704551.1 galactokinase [Agromyces sp. LY-1358]